MFNPLSLLPKAKSPSFLVLSLGLDHVKAAVFNKKDLRLEGVGRSTLENDITASVRNSVEAAAAVVDKLPKETILGIQSPFLTAIASNIQIERDQPNKKVSFEEVDSAIKTRLQDVGDGKLFFSTIASASLDNVRVPNPIGVAGKNLAISTFNAFLNEKLLTRIDSFSADLDLDVIKVLPTSFAAFKLIHTKINQDVLLVGLGQDATEIVRTKGEILESIFTIGVGAKDEMWLEVMELALGHHQHQLKHYSGVYIFGEEHTELAKERLEKANWEQMKLEKPEVFEVLGLKRLELETELDLSALAKEINE